MGNSPITRSPRVSPVVLKFLSDFEAGKYFVRPRYGRQTKVRPFMNTTKLHPDDSEGVPVKSMMQPIPNISNINRGDK